MKSLLTVISLAAFSLVTYSYDAQAQQINSFNGKWIVTWHSENRNLSAALTLSESGGKWKTVQKAMNNPCVGMEAPVQIESVSEVEIILAVKLSDALRGCSDFNVSLKKIDSNTLTGQRGPYEATAKRE